MTAVALRSLLPGVAGLALLVVAGCGTAGATGSATTISPADRSRLVGTALYVDPASHPAQEVPLLRQAGQGALADRVADGMADRPIARWFTGPQQGDPFQQAQALSTAAEAKGQAAVLTVYDLPGRDCGQFSAGGAVDDAAYAQYVGALAAGLGDRPAVVVLEPDAIPHAMQGCGSAERTHRLLREAVSILTRQPGAHVYLDAGNATWIKDRAGLAGALRDSGIGSAAGFALNVANFETTADSATYGQGLSDVLDHAHFVIDTSRNGAGAPRGGATAAAHAWCNPAGRRLGTAPTTDPGLPRVDALLWVKSPGDSDGACTPGAPAAGQWWDPLADDLLG